MEPSRIVAEFVELVRQYDTWEWEVNKNLTAKRLNDLFFMIPIEEFEMKIAHKLSTAESFTFDEVEQTLLDVEESRVDRYINRKKEKSIRLRLVPIQQVWSMLSPIIRNWEMNCPKSFPTWIILQF